MRFSGSRVRLGGVVLAVLLGPWPGEAAAQRRIQSVASWSLAGRTLLLEVEDGNIHVRGSSRVESVSAVISPGEARLWVDSARALVSRPMRAERGERLEAETTTSRLWGRMVLERTVNPTGSTFRLYLHNLAYREVVSLSMSRDQVTAFLRSLDQATRMGDRMRGILPAVPADSLDGQPALTPESTVMIAQALRWEDVREAVDMEAVVFPDGSLDSASIYVLGADQSRYLLERIVHQLQLTPPVRNGQPVRARVRVQLAARGGPQTRVEVPVQIDVRAVLHNGHDLQRVLQDEGRRLRRAGLASNVQVSFVVDRLGQPDLQTLEFDGEPAEPLRAAATAVVRRMRFIPAPTQLC
jgi:hypothetical protein